MQDATQMRGFRAQTIALAGECDADAQTIALAGGCDVDAQSNALADGLIRAKFLAPGKGGGGLGKREAYSRRA